MVTDVADGACQTPSFGIGLNAATTRSWDIKVTQYACGDEDNGGKVMV